MRKIRLRFLFLYVHSRRFVHTDFILMYCSKRANEKNHRCFYCYSKYPTGFHERLFWYYLWSRVMLSKFASVAIRYWYVANLLPSKTASGSKRRTGEECSLINCLYPGGGFLTIFSTASRVAWRLLRIFLTSRCTNPYSSSLNEEETRLPSAIHGVSNTLAYGQFLSQLFRYLGQRRLQRSSY